MTGFDYRTALEQTKLVCQANDPDYQILWSDLISRYGEEHFPLWMVHLVTYDASYALQSNYQDPPYDLMRDDCPVWEVFISLSALKAILADDFKDFDPEIFRSYLLDVCIKALTENNRYGSPYPDYLNKYHQKSEERYISNRAYTEEEYNYDPADVERICNLTSQDISLYYEIFEAAELI